jgi:cephalosporin hydroxylase
MKELIGQIARRIKRLFHERYPSRRGEGKKFRMSIGRWYLQHQASVLSMNCSWMGVTALKNPLDMWIYQEIIHEVKPDVIVEIGSAMGGSALFLAHMLDIIGSGIVVTIDIERSTFIAEHDRIVTVTGDSSSAPIIHRVEELCSGRKVLVIHDGDHNRAKVLEDIRAYAPLVSVGSYLIVEDGVIDQIHADADREGRFGDFRDGGPLRATREFLRENDSFVVDASRERYLITYNPEGFLKRVR